MFEGRFPELVIIFVVALIVLGPHKLPQVAALVGRWLGNARAMARQFRELVYPFPDSATPEDVLHYAKQQLAKLQEAQRLFDSPDEYAGNLTACKGEIPKLLMAAKKGT